MKFPRMNYRAALLFICIFLSPWNVNIHLVSNTNNKKLDKQYKLTDFWNSIGELMWHRNETLSNIADRIGRMNQSNSVCFRLLESTFRSGMSQEWSAKLINSNSLVTSNFVSNLVSERNILLGDFDQCLSLSGVNIEATLFDGMYCLVTFETPSLNNDSIDFAGLKIQTNMTDFLTRIAYRWLETRNRIPVVMAICVPSLCSTQQLNTLLNEYFEEYNLTVKINVGYCQPSQKNESNLGLVVCKTILIIWVSLCLICTVFKWIISFLRTLQIGWVHRPTMLHIVEMSKCFNCFYNLGRLFQVDNDQLTEKYELGLLYGLKAVMITLSVFIHSTTFLTVYLLSRMPIFNKYRSFMEDFQSGHRLFHNFIYRSFLLVDIFFVVSGFLASYKIFLHAKKVPNFLQYLFVHWLRLAPSMIAILCLTIVVQRIGSGPLFHQQLTDPYVQPCYDYWWTHVLLINNLWTLDKMCGPNLWFISADFQLHILLYAALCIYFYHPQYSYLFSVALTIISLLLLFVYKALSLPGLPRADFQANFDLTAPLESIRFFYTSPQVHILAYFSGVLIAMRLARVRPNSSWFHSVLAHLCLLSVLLGTILPFDALKQEDNRNQSYRILCSFLVLFVVTILCESLFVYYLLVCKSTPLKQFFSSKLLIPLGRLSLAIYLLNPLINWHSLHQSRQSAPLSFHLLQNTFFADFVRSLLWSVLFYIFFQAPFQNLRHFFNIQSEKVANKSVMSVEMSIC